MTLSELLGKRLVLLSGKGGVGKTTVAVSLALAAARLKKKTLLVEMNSAERVAPFFGLKGVGHHEIPLAPFLSGINLKPEDCFEEYVLMQIRFKALFETFVNNRFVSYFLNAIPGLNELLMIGKIYDLERQLKNRLKGERLYDLIIVDGPATGHGVSTFEVPFVVARAVRIGPLKNQSENIIKLLTNPEKTAFSVVTLAEEMPVVEAGELVGSIRSKLHIPLGPVFLNNLFESSLTEGEAEKIDKKLPDKGDPLYPYFAYSHLAFQRAKLNAHYEKIFSEENEGLDVVRIPSLDSGAGSAKALEPIVREWVGRK